MGKYIINEIYDYIERTNLDILAERFRESHIEYKKKGLQSYHFCYLEYFYIQRDYKRFLYHLLLPQAIKSKFECEMLPAFYASGDDKAPTFQNAIHDLKDYVGEYRKLEYVDSKSYQMLSTIILYRLTGHKELLFYHCDFRKHMYFDSQVIPLFRKDWSRAFVDCGACTGDTVNVLLKNGEVLPERVWAFEPNHRNYGVLQKAMRKYPFVEAICAGCGCEDTFAVLSGERMGGHIITEIQREKGDGKSVRIMRLDSVIGKDDVTFIKMDIEGAEMDALLGAEECIKRCRPIMAISVYHKLEDIHRIQTYIGEFGMDYQFMLRHYGNSISEFVLYCF